MLHYQVVSEEHINISNESGKCIYILEKHLPNYSDNALKGTCGT